MARNRFQRILTREIPISLIIAAAVALVYAQTLNHGFVNYDDPVYVTDNPAVKSGLNYESISWAFGIHKDICMYWQPVAWLSHMADCYFFGLDPRMHHLTNLILHGINSILLFIVLKIFTGSVFKSAFAAMIFALHPVNVDSVAWIAERKTLLCTFFWLLAMGAYHHYIKRPSFYRYIIVTVIFTLGLLAKPVMITFPCVLLLLDHWPLNRLKGNDLSAFCSRMIQLTIEKIPLFIIMSLWFITPFLSETLLSNETPPEVISYTLRISNALVSYAKYIVKFFLPYNLAAHYPYPDSIPIGQTLSATVFLTTTTLFFLFRSKKQPFLIIGWLWFCGTLFPTSGLILGTLWPEMADRWAYIPYIGLCIIVSWSLPLAPDKSKHVFIPVASISAAVIISFGYMAWIQAGYWKNSITLFQHSLEVTGYHFLPHQNIAAELMIQRRHDEAIPHLRTILLYEPDNVDALFNMGMALKNTGTPDQALAPLYRSIKLDPGNSKAYLAASDILFKKEKFEEAIALCKQAIPHLKTKSSILNTLSSFYTHMNRFEDAELMYLSALSENDENPDTNIAYGRFLLNRNDPEKSFYHYQKAAAFSPANPEAFNGMGLACMHMAEYDRAVAYFNKALRIDPTLSDASANIEKAMSSKRIVNKATSEVHRLLRPYNQKKLPENPDRLKSIADHYSDTMETLKIVRIYFNLATIYRHLNNYQMAIKIYQQINSFTSEYSASVYYNTACMYSLLNKPDETVQYLKLAVNHGFNLFEYYDTDNDLSNIRSTRQFVEYINLIKQ